MIGVCFFQISPQPSQKNQQKSKENYRLQASCQIYQKFTKGIYLNKCRINCLSYHVTYAFHSESILYSCLNVKELLARSRRKIWRWSDCNWTRTQNHLVRKQTLNHLAKLSVLLRTKWLWVRAQLQSFYLQMSYCFAKIFPKISMRL